MIPTNYVLHVHDGHAYGFALRDEEVAPGDTRHNVLVRAFHKTSRAVDGLAAVDDFDWENADVVADGTGPEDDDQRAYTAALRAILKAAV